MSRRPCKHCNPILSKTPKFLWAGIILRFEGNLRDLVYFWREMKLENQQCVTSCPLRSNFSFNSSIRIPHFKSKKNFCAGDFLVWLKVHLISTNSTTYIFPLMAPRLKAAVNRDECKEFLWPLPLSSSQTKPPQASQNMYKQNISELEIESDLPRILCTMSLLPCLLKICCPFSAQPTICGAQHLLALTEYKCLANTPVWLWRKQKLCFHSTPSSGLLIPIISF